MDRKLIYDLGLHTGEDTEYYLKKGFKVVAIDANPVMVKQAQKKFHSEVSSGQLTLLNVGIAESAGRVPFYVHRHYPNGPRWILKSGPHEESLMWSK